MWVAHCPGCRQRRLYSPHRVQAVHNLAPGVIAVELACYCGYRPSMLTGRAVLAATGPGDRLPAAPA